MRNIELHLIESDTDAELAIMAGLLAPDELDTLECTACLEDVGDIDGEYFSFSVVLDDTDRWFVCVTCSVDVLDPGSNSVDSLEGLLLIDEDIEPFELDEEDQI